MMAIVGLQVEPLSAILDKSGGVVTNGMGDSAAGIDKNSSADPALYLDRISTIFRLYEFRCLKLSLGGQTFDIVWVGLVNKMFFFQVRGPLFSTGWYAAPVLRRDREAVAGHLALLRHLPRQRPHHGAMLEDSPLRRPLHRHAGKLVSQLDIK